MSFLKGKKGMTLVELLVATSLFSIIAIVSASILIDVVQLEKKSSIQNAFYEDMRIILQQITNEIQAGTVDYEEYYSINVLGSTFYGINYGVYGSRFYDPGRSLDGNPTNNPEDLGVECSYPTLNIPPDTIEDCEVIYTLSTDLNTGQNPFDYPGSQETYSNAFCDTPHTSGCLVPEANELYLIDSTGTKKTILGRKKVGSSDHAIGIVRMEGLDIDQNGLVDSFRCTDDFTCYSSAAEIATAIKLPFIVDADSVRENDITLPQKFDLDMAFDPNNTQFIPITPLSINIKELTFVINPIEDPYKAFAEADMQNHPSVTIIMTAALSEKTEDSYPGDFKDITIQTTVTAGVLGNIVSYPPSNDTTWIQDINPSPPVSVPVP